MTTLYENNSSGSPTPLYANNTNWYAQTFTPQVTHGIKTVRIHAAYAHLTTPGICTVSIKAVDVDGKPTGDDLCSGTRNANLFNHSWSGTQWEEFDLGDGYPLLAGTTYAIVIRSQAPHVYCLYGYQNSTYTRGKYASSTDSGSNWTLNNTYDIWFEEYGELIAEPDVYTLPVTDIEDTAAVGNGNIEEPDGTSYITERGICYCLASHGTPDINDSKVTSEGTAGEYSIPITGLDPSADYHARAYAVANLGTYYGETVDFTTQVEMEVVQILTMADVVDEDDMASDSEVMVPTQQSVKAYADTVAAAKVSDDTYGAGWDGVTGVAPSKNAIYDKIQAMVAGGGLGDFMADGSVAMTGDLDTDGNQIVGLGAPAANGEAIRATAKITESNLEDAVDKRHSNAGDHDAMAVTGAPLTLSSQVVTFNYDSGDFQLSGNNLQVKDSGIDHGSIVGLSDNDHPQYLLKADETACFGITIDGGGSEITTGVKGYITIPYACTITGWYITGDPAGSIVVDVWKRPGAIPDDAYSIAGTERPTLAGAAVNSDANLTTWTTAVSAGDILGFNVDSVVNCQKVSLVIKVTK